MYLFYIRNDSNNIADHHIGWWELVGFKLEHFCITMKFVLIGTSEWIVYSEWKYYVGHDIKNIDKDSIFLVGFCSYVFRHLYFTFIANLDINVKCSAVLELSMALNKYFGLNPTSDK